MSSEFSFDHYFPFINPGTDQTSPLFNFELMLCIFVLIFIVSFWLSPGGLAWAVSKTYLNFQARSAIPGPSGWPILGMVMAFTSSLTHRILAKTSSSLKATKLMAFSVGLTRFVISSHPETAKEILNSSAFADRPVKESAYELLFHRAMGFAPFGDYWRGLRRISSTYLFSPKRIGSFGEFRREIGLKMVSEIKGLMEKDGEVKVRKVLHFASLNNVMMSVFGRRYEFGHGDVESSELEGLVSEGYELLGKFNWSDHFPILGWFDLQGVRKRCRKLVSRVNVFVGKIIEEHRLIKNGVKKGSGHDRDHGCGGGDFVDVLLDLQEENKLMDSDLIAILWEMIFRGTDTVAILLEWILARLVLHQDIQSKAQFEIDNIVGNKLVSDSDLPNLHYLQAIVKETLRMHPPGPLLSWARLAIHDTHVASHFIPAGTVAMVNMWSITHDEKFWLQPEEFRPERFMDEEISVMGSDLRLAPFGSGRRVCPGKAMGLATVELWLAQLLQSFKLVGSDDCGVELEEKLSLSLEMKNSLVIKAVARVSV